MSLVIQSLLWFHTYFRIIFSSFLKNTFGILIGMALNVEITLERMDIFNNTLPIQEHNIFFHFFVLSSISFMNGLKFWITMLYTWN